MISRLKHLSLVGGIVVCAIASALAQNGGGVLTMPEEEKGVQILPIYGFQLLGGQNFYTGQAPSLGANASGIVAPAMKFNDNWSLLPSLSSNYMGTREVLDLVAGGSLFQSQWDNTLTVKGLYTPDGSLWRIKPYTGFKYEFLRETSDEQLGKGLYDYRQWEGGLDAEYVYRDPFSIRFGVDYYETHFPNYTSLESQAADQFAGQDLARELVGDYVLDTHNILVTAGADWPLPWKNLMLEGKASFLDERFPNQRVVADSGDLTAALRQDLVANVDVGVSGLDYSEALKILGAFNVGYSCDDSNQSSYDASETTYLPLFYNYEELKLAPDVKLFIGPVKEALVVDVSGSWWRREYPHRPIQDAAGTYLSSSLYTDSWMAAASVSYPVAPHFHLLFNFQYGQETSNQQFLQLYQYAYKTATYLFGFSYDY